MKYNCANKGVYHKKAWEVALCVVCWERRLDKWSRPGTNTCQPTSNTGGACPLLESFLFPAPWRGMNTASRRVQGPSSSPLCACWLKDNRSHSVHTSFLWRHESISNPPDWKLCCCYSFNYQFIHKFSTCTQIMLLLSTLLYRNARLGQNHQHFRFCFAFCSAGIETQGLLGKFPTVELCPHLVLSFWMKIQKTHGLMDWLKW